MVLFVVRRHRCLHVLILLYPPKYNDLIFTNTQKIAYTQAHEIEGAFSPTRSAMATSRRPRIRTPALVHARAPILRMRKKNLEKKKWIFNSALRHHHIIFKGFCSSIRRREQKQCEKKFVERWEMKGWEARSESLGHEFCLSTFWNLFQVCILLSHLSLTFIFHY